MELYTLSGRLRCPWCEKSELYRTYHDDEWGVPLHDERALFELLCLEGAQAGLSWLTILNKREHYRRVFDNFVPEKVAAYDGGKIERLLADSGIVRNHLKIEAMIANARACIALWENGQSLAGILWDSVDNLPQQNNWRSMAEIPAQTDRSSALSATLQKLGFKFVGPVICYALMQAAGMVNDHLLQCYRHNAVQGLRRDC